LHEKIDKNGNASGEKMTLFSFPEACFFLKIVGEDRNRADKPRLIPEKTP